MLLSDPRSVFSNSSYSWEASGVTVTERTLRFSPRLTAATVPLTGDVKSTRSLYLLKNNGVPAFTRSPSLTSSLGVTPSKSRGERAYSEACGASASDSWGLPTRLMSKPLRSVMIFDMVNDFDCYVWNSSSAVSELTINSRAKVRNFSRNSPCANHYFLNLIKIWSARFRDKIRALRMLPMRKDFERIRSGNNLRKTSPRPAGRQPAAKVKKLAPNSQCSR